MEYKRLGDYIREVNVRNCELKVTNLMGISMTKKFRPSTSNVVGTDLGNYKIVEKNIFVFDTMSVIRVHKVPIAINNTDMPIIPDFDNEAPYAKSGSISGLMASCCGVV